MVNSSPTLCALEMGHDLARFAEMFSALEFVHNETDKARAGSVASLEDASRHR